LCCLHGTHDNNTTIGWWHSGDKHKEFHQTYLSAKSAVVEYDAGGYDVRGAYDFPDAGYSQSGRSPMNTRQEQGNWIGVTADALTTTANIASAIQVILAALTSKKNLRGCRR
jgi:4-alpha-glucanotransferase